MLQRRNWLLRTSMLINLLLLVYIASQVILPTVPTMETAEDDRSAGEPSRRILLDVGSPPTYVANTNTLLAAGGGGGGGSSVYPTNRTSTVPTEHSTTESALQNSVDCVDRRAVSHTAQRGDFWVLYNYLPASRTFRCWESVTYTTHSDFTFLDNLEVLLERWRGPVSLALHAPGTDFDPTLKSVRYLRDCSSQPVADLVSFHLYFPSRHLPKSVPRHPPTERYNCSLGPPWAGVRGPAPYKAQKKLVYPVNVGRNVARESALTHYVLASDIELYPSPGLVPAFLDMVRRQDPPLRHTNPKVFPLSIFELQSNTNLPTDKTELVTMLKNGTAIPFHKKVCPGCHNVPHSKEWAEAAVKPGLAVFHIGKRQGYFVHWEPIYIGTHQDPLYDERLSWEGKSDKMTQGYVLCVLDYEFQILDNAFLVHKPGIKTLKKDPARAILAAKTNSLIRKAIFPELKILFGTKKGCAV